MTLEDFKAKLAAIVEHGKGQSDAEFLERMADVEARIKAYRRREQEIADRKKGDVEPVPHWSESKREPGED